MSARERVARKRSGGPPAAPSSAGYAMLPDAAHSQESERAILGAVLLHPAVLSTVSSILAAEDFYAERHRVLYQAMLDLRDVGTEIDLRTLQAWLEQRGQFATTGGISYLATLDLDLPDISRVDAYARIVRERSLRRKLYGATLALMAKASNGSTVAELTEAAADCSRSAAVLVAENQPAEPLYKTEEEIDAEVYPPVPWVLGNVLSEGSAAMLAGKPGAGKTWFALEFGMRVARGLDFLNFDCPSDRRVLYIAAEGGYANYKHDMSRLALGLERKPGGRFALSTWGAKLNDAAARQALSGAIKTFSAEVVVLDSIALLFNLRNENDTDGWALVNDYLLELMHEGLSVLALHHANKAGDVTGSLSNIRCVDQALVLAKPEDRERDLDVDATLRYVKARRVDPRYTAPITLRLCNGVAGPGSIGYVRTDAHNDRRRMAVELWDGPLQPSVADIAREMGVSGRTIHRYLTTALEAGETARALRPYGEKH